MGTDIKVLTVTLLTPEGLREVDFEGETSATMDGGWLYVRTDGGSVAVFNGAAVLSAIPHIEYEPDHQEGRDHTKSESPYNTI